MNPLISGLILATISALAFIAYKHPKEFRVVENLLMIVLGSLMLGLTIWNSSAEILGSKLGIVFSGEEKMKKILADHLVLDGYLFITWIAVFVYLGLLRLLPTLGIIDKKKEEPPAEPKPEEPKKNA